MKLIKAIIKNLREDNFSGHLINILAFMMPSFGILILIEILFINEIVTKEIKQAHCAITLFLVTCYIVIVFIIKKNISFK